MAEYIIWFKYENEMELMNACPFLDTGEAENAPPTALWPDGFKYLVQELSSAEFSTVDAAANSQIAINVMPFQPTLYPPYSPTQK